MAMKPRIGTPSHAPGIESGPKHSHAMIKNEAPIASRVFPMRASSPSKRARRALHSASRCEYCSFGDIKNSLAHLPADHDHPGAGVSRCEAHHMLWRNEI